MRARQLTVDWFFPAAAAVLCLSLTGITARAQGDRPLTKGDIIRHWDGDPRQDVQTYIEKMVKKRKVGFLPTQGVRNELKGRNVPPAVIDALRENFHERSQFKFQVWLFEPKQGALSSAELTSLADAIIDELQHQSMNLRDVFPHFKPPYPEPCVQTRDGTNCSVSGYPLLQIKGSVERSGNRHKATFRLSYMSPVDPQLIGGPQETIIESKSEAGLKRAAADIVRKIHQNVRQEVKEF